MRLYPESAAVQLEFDKVKALLKAHCATDYAKNKADNLRIHTRKEYIELELKQTNEYKNISLLQQYFPNDFSLNLSKDIKLLGIPGALLGGEQWMPIRRLTENTGSIFRWFDNDRRTAFPGLAKVIEGTYFEKQIIENIDEILDENGTVRDNASEDLQKIRMIAEKLLLLNRKKPLN